MPLPELFVTCEGFQLNSMGNKGAPMSTMGVPCASISASIRLRICRARSASTPASPVSPSCVAVYQ